MSRFSARQLRFSSAPLSAAAALQSRFPSGHFPPTHTHTSSLPSRGSAAVRPTASPRRDRLARSCSCWKCLINSKKKLNFCGGSSFPRPVTRERSFSQARPSSSHLSGTHTHAQTRRSRAVFLNSMGAVQEDATGTPQSLVQHLRLLNILLLIGD